MTEKEMNNRTRRIQETVTTREYWNKRLETC